MRCGAAGGRGRGAPFASGFDGAGAAELGGAFPHGAEADAGSAVGIESVAVVCDLELEGAVRRQPNGTDLRVGVTHDVGKCFEADAVGGNLDSGWELGEAARPVDRDVKAAVEAGRMLAEGAHEAELVQGGRPQVVDEPADVCDRGLCVRAELEQRLSGLRRLADELIPGAVQP